MRYARIMGVTAVAILWTTFATWAADLPGCTAPAGFQDNPHPAIAPMDQTCLSYGRDRYRPAVGGRSRGDGQAAEGNHSPIEGATRGCRRFHVDQG